MGALSWATGTILVRARGLTGRGPRVMEGQVWGPSEN